MLQSQLNFRLVQAAVVVLVEMPVAALHVGQELVQALEFREVDGA